MSESSEVNHQDMNKLISSVSEMATEIKHLANSFSELKDTFKDSHKELRDENKELEKQIKRQGEKINDLEKKQAEINTLLSIVSENQQSNRKFFMGIAGTILGLAVIGGLAFKLTGA